MKPRTARVLLVVTVFALLVLVTATRTYVGSAIQGHPPRIAASSKVPAFGVIFVSRFSYYLAWALVAPGVFWLGRRVPLRRSRPLGPLAVHLAVPVVASGPFLCLRWLLDAALGAGLPPPSLPWTVFLFQPFVALPVYWLLLACGATLQLMREQRKNELRTAVLQRSLAGARLEALKMKVQPQFLFNTLNAIASLARTGDMDAVTRVVEHLGTLLRLSMEAGGRQLVRLEEELALLDEYLAIQEIRFEERLHLVRRIAPGVGDALVPSLLLQPLVENAFMHGLGRRPDAGLLEIRAMREGQTLRVVVRDDGPGLPPGWTLAAGAGASLRSIVERLGELYASRARFELRNDPAGGASVSLSIPFDEAASPAG